MTVKRVAVIAYHSSPLHEPGTGDAGGMTVYVRQLAAALAVRGVHTDIFTRATSPEDRVTFISDDVRVVPVDAGPREILDKEELPDHIDDFVASVRAFATVQRIRYDIVHSHYWQSGMAAKHLAQAWDLPLVHSPHTLGRVKNARLAPGDAPEPEVRLLGEQQVISAADVLIANTEDEYQAFACMYKAPHDKLKELSPGVDHANFRPGDRAEARAELGLDPDRPVLLFVGRIQRLKGIELAIRTVAELGTYQGREPLLLIVGGASGRGGEEEVERLESIARELGIADRVRFLGPKPHTKLPAHYRAADVTLICSHNESFGLAALEAHASGCPVVGTPVGGLSHVVRDGESGFLIDERDPAQFAASVDKILSDPDLAASFSRAALVGSLPFSWDGTAERFIDLYDCLINERFPELCTC